MYLEMIDDGAYDWMSKVCDAPELTSNAERIRFLTEKLKPYGFYLIGSGTNRVVYCKKGTATEEYDICFKVALDSRGKKDNLQEYNLFLEAPASVIEKKYFIEVYELSDDCLVAVERKADYVMDMYAAKRKRIDREKMFSDLDQIYLLDDASPYGNCGIIKDYDAQGNEIQRVCMIDYANFVKKEGLHLFCTSDECFGIEDESTFLVYNSSLTGMVCPNCGKSYSFADIKGTGKSEYTDREAMSDFLGSVRNVGKKKSKFFGDLNEVILEEIEEVYSTGQSFMEREYQRPVNPYDDIEDAFDTAVQDAYKQFLDDEEESQEEDEARALRERANFATHKRMSNTEVLADIRETLLEMSDEEVDELIEEN